MPWALVLDLPASPAALVRLAELRGRTDLQASLDARRLVVRGDALDAELDRRLRAVPGGRRFDVAADGLIAPGARLPADRLPAGPWRRLEILLELGPVDDAPATSVAPLGLRLVQAAAVPGATDASARGDGLLITTRAAWAAWAATAPAVRLAPLQLLARADADELLVRGAPPPPIPGASWAVDRGVAIPAGLAPSPPLDATTLAALLGLTGRDDGPGDLVLLHPGADGRARAERLDGARFVPATRAGARALAATPAPPPARGP